MVKSTNALFAFVTVADSAGLEGFADAAVSVGDLLGALFEHELDVVGLGVGDFLDVLWRGDLGFGF